MAPSTTRSFSNDAFDIESSQEHLSGVENFEMELRRLNLFPLDTKQLGQGDGQEISALKENLNMENKIKDPLVMEGKFGEIFPSGKSKIIQLTGAELLNQDPPFEKFVVLGGSIRITLQTRFQVEVAPKPSPKESLSFFQRLFHTRSSSKENVNGLKRYGSCYKLQFAESSFVLDGNSLFMLNSIDKITNNHPKLPLSIKFELNTPSAVIADISRLEFNQNALILQKIESLEEKIRKTVNKVRAIKDAKISEAHLIAAKKKNAVVESRKSSKNLSKKFLFSARKIKFKKGIKCSNVESINCANPSTEPRDDRFAEVEDLYMRIALVGVGSFGKVFMIKDKIAESKSYGKIFAMKQLNKRHLIKTGQVVNTITERNVLREINHPFCINLVHSFQDSNSLYLVTEIAQGGDLFGLMQEKVRFSVLESKFFASCILDALFYLHDRNIIFRDLKPENILLDAKGFLRLADFGFAKKIDLKAGERTYTMQGTAEYISPELLDGNKIHNNTGHDYRVDYWALGVLIYEMICAITPFAVEYGEDAKVICERIMNDRPDLKRLRKMLESQVSNTVSPQDQEGGEDRYEKNEKFTSAAWVKEGSQAASEGEKANVVGVIQGLLRHNQEKRLSCFPSNDFLNVKAHPFFSNVDFEALASRHYEAPYFPLIESAEDIHCFDSFGEEDEKDKDSSPLSKSHRNMFLQF
eukprot:augustus_masked-scaffold_15-processed-gene-7.75-mRNA-1 protein AED:0.54 eAED:0.55 QI:0/-1/0/1/-1/1/1/0/695